MPDYKIYSIKIKIIYNSNKWFYFTENNKIGFFMINNSVFSSLINKNFIPDHLGDKKIVLKGNDFVWLSEAEIKSQHLEKLSISAITDIIQKTKFEGLKENEYKNLENNLEWINRRIQSHNHRIETNFLKKVANAVVSFFSFGRFHLTCDELDDKIVMIQKELSEKKALIAKKFSNLAKNPDQLKGNSQLSKELIQDFLDFPLSGESLRDLITLWGYFPDEDKETLTSHFSDYFKYLDLPVTDELFSLFLGKVEKVEKHISRELIQKIAKFVEDNRDKLEQKQIGTSNKAHLTKIKANSSIPYDITYNRENGDIIVNLGRIGTPGTFKTIRKLLHLQNLELQVIGKQKKDKISDGEAKMIEAAKGLPYVIQAHKVEEYQSTKKKGESRISILLPFCNMGDLELSIKNNQLSDLDKLQVTSDMMKGVMNLHSRGIIHRDIKPANIFVNKVMENGKEVVHGVVADLGLACSKGSPGPPAGTLPYIPPEIVKVNKRLEPIWINENYRYAPESDSWAIGVSLKEIFGKEGEDIEKKEEPKDKNSIDYLIWGLLRRSPERRMKLPDALAIIENLLGEEKKRQTIKS